jgi:hypothetical protein
MPMALLLEDYSSNRQLLSGLLSAAGCEVRSDVPILFISGTPISGWRLCDRENLKRLSTHLVEFLENHISTFLDKVRQMLAYRSVSR